MRKLSILFLFGAILAASLSSCKSYLDIVPDNVATIDNAFTLRSQAKKYLYTCYSFLPNPGSIDNSPAFLRAELWPLSAYTGNSSFFVRDQQNVVDPYLNYWEGRRGGTDLMEGIRGCNIFLENVYNVPNMDEMEKDQWAAEVKFLKAYYLFYLVRLYGPIPLMKENLPVDVDITEFEDHREPVDSCFNYITSLIDEAIPDLPNRPIANIDPPQYGRINQPVAKAIKAKILVMAASPLFNGNSDYANYIDKEKGVLFNQEFSEEKWKLARDAARDAVESCESVGYQLFQYVQGVGQDLSDTTITKLSIRLALSSRDVNGEIIWPYTGAFATQTNLTPRSWDPDRIITSMQGRYAPSLDVVDLFYTSNGLPIEEDKEWDYENRGELDTVKHEDRYNLLEKYVTVKMHFDREPRFYASTGFDGGIWYGQGRYDDNNTWHIKGRAGDFAAAHSSGSYSPTSYWPKKNINYQNTVEASSYKVNSYSFPFIRLADVYLLYAEASNEADGPNAEAYTYLNKVRERAGIPSVEEAWDNHAQNPGKYTTKEGLREIIRREREVELIYESNRYWDLLRWKTAEKELSKPVRGWTLTENDPELFYNQTILFQRRFTKRDYFMPIRELELQRNRNMIQSPFW